MAYKGRYKGKAIDDALAKAETAYQKPEEGIPASDLASDVFLQGEKGDTGESGATFTPNVSTEGVLSWSNDKGLNNPASVNIKGPKGDTGEKGEQGIQGIQGEKGADGAKGDKGDKGDTGATGATGPAGPAYPIINYGTSNTAGISLSPNTFYIWGTVSYLELYLGGEIGGTMSEYVFQFTSGSTATTLALPTSVKWAGGMAPSMEANKTYQISIVNYFGTVLSF